MIPFSIEDLASVAAALEKSGLVVIGGQALNYWADHFEIPGGPHTSKDLDLQGTKDAAERAAAVLDARALLPALEMDLVNVALIETSTASGRTLEINVIHSVFGLRGPEVEKFAIPVEMHGALVRVMHPVHVMESRIANVGGLRRSDPHSLNQARVSVECAKGMIRELADRDVRYALKLIQRVFRFARDNIHARSVYKDFDIDSFEAIERLGTLPPNFAQEAYPRMRAELERRRR